MSCFRSSETGPFLGLATKRRLQAWQRKLGVPDRDLPLRTTWVEWHRGQGGIGSGLGVAVSIHPGYRFPRHRATTRITWSGSGARFGSGAGDS